MTANPGSQTLVDALSRKQIVGESQIEAARDYGRDHRVSVERALVELDILSENDLNALYDELFQVRAIKLEDVEIDREAVRHVPAAVARRHCLIPVRRSGNALAVAMAEPADEQAMQALRSVTDFEIIPFVARYDAIEHAVFLHYGDPAAGEENAESASAPAVHPRKLIDDDRIGQVGRSLPLRRERTFESFVEDAANQFPLSIARAIAAWEAEEGYNPFHCWGPAGCGKSHLLHALVASAGSRAPLKRVILTTGEQFVDDLFECIRDRKLNFFRFLYREADLLAVDAADALLTRDWAQRELAATIRHMQHGKRFMVIAARRNLVLEARIAPELRVALESGVIANFAAHSTETKAEILRRRSGAVDLPGDVLRTLAECSDNLTDLIALLQQAVVLSALDGAEVTASIIEDLVHLCGAVSAEESVDDKRVKG